MHFLHSRAFILESVLQSDGKEFTMFTFIHAHHMTTSFFFLFFFFFYCTGLKDFIFKMFSGQERILPYFRFPWISLCLQVGLLLLDLDYMERESEKGQASSVAPFKIREIQFNKDITMARQQIPTTTESADHSYTSSLEQTGPETSLESTSMLKSSRFSGVKNSCLSQ